MTPQGSHHLNQPLSSELSLQPALPKYMIPAGEDPQHMVIKTDPQWPNSWIHLFPLNTPLPPHNIITTLSLHKKANPLVPMMDRGVVNESCGDRKIESQGTEREARMYMRLVGFRRYTTDQDSYPNPSARDSSTLTLLST